MALTLIGHIGGRETNPDIAQIYDTAKQIKEAEAEQQRVEQFYRASRFYQGTATSHPENIKLINNYIGCLKWAGYTEYYYCYPLLNKTTIPSKADFDLWQKVKQIYKEQIAFLIESQKESIATTIASYMTAQRIAQDSTNSTNTDNTPEALFFEHNELCVLKDTFKAKAEAEADRLKAFAKLHSTPAQVKGKSRG